MPQEGSDSESDHAIAYGLFRFTLGINILIHGFVRLYAGVEKFAASTEPHFAETPLPAPLVHVFLITLPFIEMIIGALLTVGLWTRWALLAGGLLMAALVFGTALRSDWTTVSEQMIYVIAYYLLLVARRHNRFSLDGMLNRRR